MIRLWSLLTLTLTLLAGSALADPSWSEVEAAPGWTEHATEQHDVIGEVLILHAVVGGIDCFQARASTPASSTKLLEVVRDVVGIAEFSDAGISAGRILARDGDGLDYFQYFDTPGWTMAKDRFWFLRGRVIRSGPVTTWTWSRLVQGGPHRAVWDEVVAEHPKAIEPTANVGAWHFTKQDGPTAVRYYVCSDSGGSIPRKLQFMATTQTLPDTVADVLTEAVGREGR
jgi:hypothetical protein